MKHISVLKLIGTRPEGEIKYKWEAESQWVAHSDQGNSGLLLATEAFLF